jgi:hypothetical protein
MKKFPKILILFTLVILNCECIGQTTLTGIVVDRDGKPLADVLYRLSGYGKRQAIGGDIGFQKTDLGGRFAIQVPSEKSVADLQFDQPPSGRFPSASADLQFNYRELAPVVLNDVTADGVPLRVVMTEGMLVEGSVVELVNGKRVPISGATIALAMPQWGFWYHKEQGTGSDGKFHFRISEPPKGRHWQLVYGGKYFNIQYDPKQPKVVVELMSDIKMTVKSD